jgi:hypothetical protein
MNDDRRSILNMLAEGKITADEAERLLAALDRAPASEPREPVLAQERPKAKFLRVQVDALSHRDRPTKVNIRVPMQMLRAGVRLSSLIPPEARDEVNAAMRKKGMTIDLSELKPENLEELIDSLQDVTIDVDEDRAKVRIFAE